MTSGRGTGTICLPLGRSAQLQLAVHGLSSDQAQALQLLVVLLFVVGTTIAANLGEKSNTWRVIAYLLTLVAAATLALLALLSLALVVLAPGSADTAARADRACTTPLAAGAGLGLPAGGAAGAALLAPVRRFVARLVRGFRADSPINAVGLALYL